LVQRADAARYVAKGQGRNKVVRYSEMTTAVQPPAPQREAS